MGTLLFMKKGHFAPRPGTAVLKQADYTLLLETEAILDAALVEAESIREEARTLYAAEKERGYADGIAEGKMEMAERMMDTVAAGVDYLEGLEGSIVDLVMQAMRKIIEGFDDKERVIGVVRKGLGYARSQKRVVLRVCP
jgi:type III secretion protein L